MFKLIKESFCLTNKYIVLATPLILFSLISSLYILFSMRGNKIGLIISIILFFLMLGAFLSGWLYMITRCVKNSFAEDANQLIKEFPTGVGEYFLPALGMIATSFLLCLGLFIISILIGVKFIGDPQISQTAVSNSLSSIEAMRKFALSLTDEQLVKINLWNILMFGSMSLSYFLIMFYAPAMFMKNKNPIFAFGHSIKDLFSRKFFKNALLYIFISAVYLILSIFIAIWGENIIMHFIFTLTHFYFVVFAAVLIFNYYYKNFVRIGGNIDETV